MQPSQARENAKMNLKAEVSLRPYSSTFSVTFSSPKRSEPLVGTPERTLFAVRKDLITQVRMLTPTSSVHFAKICQLEPQCTEVVLFAFTNYKTYNSAVLKLRISKKSKYLSDTSSGPNLLNKSHLDPIWSLHLKRLDVLNFKSANK